MIEPLQYHIHRIHQIINNDTISNNDVGAPLAGARKITGDTTNINTGNKPCVTSIYRRATARVAPTGARKIIGDSAFIERAVSACINSGHDPDNHFTHVGKMVELGSGAQREIQDPERGIDAKDVDRDLARNGRNSKNER